MNESAPSFNEPLPADGRLPRRTVLKWFAAAAVAVELQPLNEIALGAAAPALKAKGYGTDPNVAGYFKPGDYWPLTLTGGQRRAGVALADLLFPADKFGPAASELRVIDFIDEWISAPYPDQRRDRAEILPGLQWMDDESNRRFKREFAALADAEKRTICDDICWPADAAPKMKWRRLSFRNFARSQQALTTAQSRAGKPLAMWATRRSFNSMAHPRRCSTSSASNKPSAENLTPNRLHGPLTP